MWMLRTVHLLLRLSVMHTLKWPMEGCTYLCCSLHERRCKKLGIQWEKLKNKIMIKFRGKN